MKIGINHHYDTLQMPRSTWNGPSVFFVTSSIIILSCFEEICISSSSKLEIVATSVKIIWGGEGSIIQAMYVVLLTSAWYRFFRLFLFNHLEMSRVWFWIAERYIVQYKATHWGMIFGGCMAKAHNVIRQNSWYLPLAHHQVYLPLGQELYYTFDRVPMGYSLPVERGTPRTLCWALQLPAKENKCG